jgi:hypothetical protein
LRPCTIVYSGEGTGAGYAELMLLTEAPRVANANATTSWVSPPRAARAIQAPRARRSGGQASIELIERR